VLREGSDKPIDFAVVRDEFPLQRRLSLHDQARNRLHAYLRFNETTEHEVGQALEEMGDLKV